MTLLGAVLEKKILRLGWLAALTAVLTACSTGGAPVSAVRPNGYAPTPQQASSYTILARARIPASTGGRVSAGGVALTVPAHALVKTGTAAIAGTASGVYDISVTTRLVGKVAVTIPLSGPSDLVVHYVNGAWKVESARFGQQTVWVTHLSPFSSFTSLTKKFSCLSVNPKQIVLCLIKKGIQKVSAGFAAWLAHQLNLGDACTQSIIGGGGWLSDIKNAFSGACVGQAGGPGDSVPPPAGAGTNTGSSNGSSTSGNSGPPSTGPAGCEALVTDLTVPDGTTVSPGQTFNKAWRLRNCGTTNWSSLTAVRVAGSYGPASFPVPTIAPGATADVTVLVTAPTQPGLSRATYRLRAPDGHYADNSFWVEVNVVAPVSGNRQAVTSYDQMRPGAPYHGYFATAWQPFTAASNTITWISATIGNPAAAAGVAVQGSTLTLRICIDPSCSVIIAETHPNIVNYGETGADIRDVAVTQGKTYYLVWYQPPSINGLTWVTYWWGGGNTISTSDLLQAAVRGYQR